MISELYKVRLLRGGVLLKKIKELLMVNDTGMSIGLLIMITVFIPVMTRKNLFYGLSPCL